MARIARGKQQQRGAKTLASSAEEVAGNFGNRQESGRALSRQFFFYKDEVVSDEIENLPGCEQRDGFPPCLHKPFSTRKVRVVDRTVSCATTKTVNRIRPDFKQLWRANCARRGLRQGLADCRSTFTAVAGRA